MLVCVKRTHGVIGGCACKTNQSDGGWVGEGRVWTSRCPVSVHRAGPVGPSEELATADPKPVRNCSDSVSMNPGSLGSL